MTANSLAAPVDRPPARRVTPVRPPPAAGSWKYRTERRSRIALGIAIAVSAGVHFVVLFGFNRHAPTVRPRVVDDSIAVTLAMPDLKELENPEPQPNDSDLPADQGLTVPTLADVPSQVDLSTAFVQQIDYSTLVPRQDLATAATLAIPTVINRSGGIGAGMGKIFDLKDLDRAPQPTVQVSPVVPGNLKQSGTHVEVAVAFIVDTHGAVVNPYVVRTTDYRFNDCAVTAIGKWKFRPGIKNGRRVSVRMLQPVVIDVKESD